MVNVTCFIVNFTAGYSINNGERYNAPVTSDYDSNTLSYGVSLSQAIFRMDTWYSLDAAEKRALQAQAGFIPQLPLHKINNGDVAQVKEWGAQYGKRIGVTLPLDTKKKVKKAFLN